ncbi:MAG: SRPBCC family protein [Parcubacteria group bacterium]
MGVKLEHRIGIQAPADVIWESLVDIAGWENWNPLYPRAEGTIRIGNVLNLTVNIPDQKPREIHPRILDWAPADHIHWTLSMMGGLVKTIRYLEIEVLSETGCIFSNGEIFDGLLGPSIARRYRRQLRAAFASMGEALQARAEAAWRERQRAPT